MRVFMQSRGTDEECMKAQKCRIIGGLSLFGGFQADLTGPAVWAITSMDAYGLFPEGAVGADYSISGFVALVAALEAFRGVNWTTATRPLRFGFFDGETTGYLGSQRFLREIQEFKCDKYDGDGYRCVQPQRLDMRFRQVSLADIETVVEIRQVASATSLYAHVMESEKELAFVADLRTIAGVGLKSATTNKIPPSSTNSFLRANPQLRHVVLTGFAGKYPPGNSYGSPNDNRYNVARMVASAQSLALILANLTGVTLTASVNESVVEGLMSGFVGVPASSDYIQSLFPTSRLPTDHVSLYTGPYGFYRYELKQLVVRKVLMDVVTHNATTVPCIQDSNCSRLRDPFNHTFFCSLDGFCEAVPIAALPAYSLAYEWDTDDERYFIANASAALPRGAEADWLTPDLQFITLPAPLTGRIVTGVGIALWGGTTLLLGLFWRSNLGRLKTS